MSLGFLSQLVRTTRIIVSHPLNRTSRLRAMGRFVHWQLAGRFAPGRLEYRWVEGVRVLARVNDVGFTGNVYCGLFEFEEMAYTLHTMSENDLFVDIGANVGVYTLLACGVRGARGVCFEPVPETFQRLRDNIRLNDLDDRVETHNMGLAEAEGELRFTASEDCMNHVIPDGEDMGVAVRVPVTILDKVLASRSPNMLKIDVEGFELPVLRGAGTALSNPALHSVIAELNGSGVRYGYEDVAVADLLEGYGLRPFSYEPFRRELKPVSIENVEPRNVLFVRDPDAVREKIAKAPRITLGGHRI